MPVGPITKSNWGTGVRHGKSFKAALMLISKKLGDIMELNYDGTSPGVEENKLELA